MRSAFCLAVSLAILDAPPAAALAVLEPSMTGAVVVRSAVVERGAEPSAQQQRVAGRRVWYAPAMGQPIPAATTASAARRDQSVGDPSRRALPWTVTIPEPAAWGFLIGAFTIVGTALRRRTRGVVSA